MNVVFVIDGAVITPPLSGTILPGITRDSVIKLAPDLGFSISEERIDIDRVLADVRAGRVTEAFGIVQSSEYNTYSGAMR